MRVLNGIGPRARMSQRSLCHDKFGKIVSIVENMQVQNQMGGHVRKSKRHLLARYIRPKCKICKIKVCLCGFHHFRIKNFSKSVRVWNRISDYSPNNQFKYVKIIKSKACLTIILSHAWRCKNIFKVLFSFGEHKNFPCLKLIEIVILWVYYTIPFGFSLFRHFLVITFQLFILHVWLRITDEGSVPEMRILSISLI